MANEGAAIIGLCAQLGAARARVSVAPMKPIAKVLMLTVLPLKGHAVLCNRSSDEVIHNEHHNSADDRYEHAVEIETGHTSMAH
jgi:hypothetical protein